MANDARDTFLRLASAVWLHSFAVNCLSLTVLTRLLLNHELAKPRRGKAKQPVHATWLIELEPWLLCPKDVYFVSLAPRMQEKKKKKDVRVLCALQV